jgi:hypothetical protein
MSLRAFVMSSEVSTQLFSVTGLTGISEANAGVGTFLSLISLISQVLMAASLFAGLLYAIVLYVALWFYFRRSQRVAAYFH